MIGMIENYKHCFQEASRFGLVRRSDSRLSEPRMSGQLTQKLVDDFPGLLGLLEPRHMAAFVDERDRRILDKRVGF